MIIESVIAAGQRRADATEFTCQCGRVLPTMCAPCAALSFTVESAKRRPQWLERLGMSAPRFDAYDRATERLIRVLTANGTLRHVMWGKRGALFTPSLGGDPPEHEQFRIADEDWFLTSGEWAPVFDVLFEQYYRDALTPPRVRA